MSQLTGAQMKYLHVIYRAAEEDCSIRPVDIARELHVTKASVSKMMKILVEAGLIAIKADGNIVLTAKGKGEGIAIHQKVGTIYPFFANHLELDEPEAIDNTYLFLSSFSEYCVEKLLQKGWKVANNEC